MNLYFGIFLSYLSYCEILSGSYLLSYPAHSVDLCLRSGVGSWCAEAAVPEGPCAAQGPAVPGTGRCIGALWRGAHTRLASHDQLCLYAVKHLPAKPTPSPSSPCSCLSQIWEGEKKKRKVTLNIFHENSNKNSRYLIPYTLTAININKITHWYLELAYKYI